MVDRPSDVRPTVLKLARREARELGSATVEAEHLLLALTRAAGPAGIILADAGLDNETLHRALDDEFETSLREVGVRLGDFDLPPAPPSPGTPRVGTSAKLALLRAAGVARTHGHRRITSTHLLLGLTRARAGIVPRTLTLAGVDTTQLAARAEAALDRSR